MVLFSQGHPKLFENCDMVVINTSKQVHKTGERDFNGKWDFFKAFPYMRILLEFLTELSHA